MGEDSNRFKVIISISKESGGDVYFKSDGKRFDADSTIKMNVETNYIFTVTLRPPHILEDVTLMGSRVTAKETKKDEDKTVYTLPWYSAGFPTTKRAKREKLPLTLEIRNIGSLKAMFQVKLYKAQEVSHTTWGSALHQIEYDCESKCNAAYINVIKETFR